MFLKTPENPNTQIQFYVDEVKGWEEPEPDTLETKYDRTERGTLYQYQVPGYSTIDKKTQAELAWQLKYDKEELLDKDQLLDGKYRMKLSVNYQTGQILIEWEKVSLL